MSEMTVGRITFSPGPWEARATPTGRWKVHVKGPMGGRGTVRHAPVLWDVANGLPAHDTTAEGNARLVAAAPDLLDACQRALALLSCYRGSPEQIVSDALRAAIAKAEGR